MNRFVEFGVAALIVSIRLMSPGGHKPTWAWCPFAALGIVLLSMGTYGCRHNEISSKLNLVLEEIRKLKGKEESMSKQLEDLKAEVKAHNRSGAISRHADHGLS